MVYHFASDLNEIHNCLDYSIYSSLKSLLLHFLSIILLACPERHYKDWIKSTLKLWVDPEPAL